tara:strand:+ start:440 stop:1192 length:753 start_codon:yes stop_codon:yes gene_type:complete
MPKNDFSESAKYYGLMCSNPKEIERRSNFVTDTLKKHKIKSVLDLGCGNGLYLSPLKKSKFDVEGLDISKEMIKEARKKNKSIKLYLQDMSKFNIHKKYDAIICLDSSLVLLPNFQMIEKTIKKCNEHLNQGGILLLDLPNHKKEIKEANFEQSSGTSKIPRGRIDAIYRDHRKGDKWITDWFGFVKRGKNFFQFREHYEELIYSPRKLENSLKKNGFKILSTYGTRKGGNFDPNKSYRRFYLCKKRKIL